MKREKWVATVLIVLICSGLLWISKNYFASKKTVVADSKLRPAPRSQGDPNAPIKVIEFMDPQCKSCADASKLMKNYIYTYPKKIYWQIKFFPLVKAHLYALKSAIYSECAVRQDHFWLFFEAVLKAQDEWAASSDPDIIFTRIAIENSLDEGALRVCVEEGEAKKTVMAEKDEATALGVQATPSFFVNGKLAVGTEALQEELNRLLH